MRNTIFKKSLIFIAIAYAPVSASGAAAEEPRSSPTEGNSPSHSGLALEEIVVTGVGNNSAITKFQTSYGISTFGEDFLTEKAPLGAADLLREVPGFWSESSGGETGNNVFVRGTPNSGGFRYVSLLEGGLPYFEESRASFSGADLLSRIDLTTERVEVVRGGTAAIFNSNSPAGAINFIPKRGSQTPEGAMRLTAGDTDLYRVDVFYGGPVNEDVVFSVGGFYRLDDGVRETGWTANDGGQWRANFTVDKSWGQVHADYKKLDDRVVFYTPIPIELDGSSPQDSLGSFDALTDTLHSGELRFLTIPDPNPTGDVNVDLKDGTGADVDTFTLETKLQLGNDWTLFNKTRHTDGRTWFNGLFSIGGIRNAEAVIADPSIVPGVDGAGLAGLGASAYELRYATTGEVIADPGSLNGNGLLVASGWWTPQNFFDNTIIDTQLAKTLESGGQSHDITVGAYLSQFDFRQYLVFNTVLTDVSGEARLIDIVGDNGASVTDHGVTQWGATGRTREVDYRVLAFYMADNWQFNEKLRIDAGFRYQETRMLTQRTNTPTTDLDGDPLTLADNNAQFSDGSWTSFDQEFDDSAWTLGFNYEFSESIALFGRYTDAFRMPRFSSVWGGSSDQVVEGIIMAEGGLKLFYETFSAALVVYWSEFDNFQFSNDVIQNGEIVQLDIRTETETTGLEIELNWAPLDSVEIAFNGYLQKPEYVDFVFDDIQPDPDNPGEFIVTRSDFDGNQIRRQPEVSFNLRPKWYLGRAQLYANIQYAGKRYSDVANTNELEAYTQVDLGAIYSLSDSTELQLVVNNALNEVGLTEGDPRSGQITGSDTSSGFALARPILGRSVRASIQYEF